MSTLRVRRLAAALLVCALAIAIVASRPPETAAPATVAMPPKPRDVVPSTPAAVPDPPAPAQPIGVEPADATASGGFSLRAGPRWSKRPKPSATAKRVAQAVPAAPLVGRDRVSVVAAP